MGEQRRGPLYDLLDWTFRVQPHGPQTIWHRRRERNKEVVKLLVLVVLNAVFNFAGFYERFEWADFDRLQMTANPTGGRVAMVLITDDEYNDPQLFKRTSPLPVPALANVISAICDFKPRVIGVDLITSDWTATDYDTQWPATAPCPIVWSIDWTEDDAPTDSHGAIYLERVVGRETSDARVCAAVPILPVDPDGVVRNYSVAQPAKGSAPATYGTLVWALARSVETGAVPCEGKPIVMPAATAADREGTERKIRFSANRALPRLRVNDVVAAHAQPDELSGPVRRILEDAVVILGGTFRHARDVYRTPIGPLSGSEILANAVVTESDSANAIDSVSPWVSFAIDLVVGLVLLTALTRLRLRWPVAIAISSGVTIFLAFFLSWALFNYLGYFLGIFGSLSGVVLGIIIEASWDSVATQLKDWWGGVRARVNIVLGRESL